VFIFVCCCTLMRNKIYYYNFNLITSDKEGGKCFCPRLSVCLSVCLLARLLKNACMDLDEMLRVDIMSGYGRTD